MADDGQPATEITPEHARQGVTGHNVRYVLVFSMALVVIALLVVAWLMKP